MTSQCPDCGAVMQGVSAGKVQGLTSDVPVILRCPWATEDQWKRRVGAVVSCGRGYPRDPSERAEWRRVK